MGATGSFPVDLVLMGMVAAFLVLRLRGILGKRTGFERPVAPPQAARSAPGPIVDAKAEPAVTARAPIMPDPASPLGQVLTGIGGIDRNFEPVAFLNGAAAAFRMIVDAFAKGDRTALRPLLADDTYAAFEQAITAREGASETHVSDIRNIEAVTIEAADLRGSVAAITVRIVSDQVSLTRDAAGRVVSGNDAVTEITDLWTFERDLRSPDPTWRLVAARSA